MEPHSRTAYIGRSVQEGGRDRKRKGNQPVPVGLHRTGRYCGHRQYSRGGNRVDSGRTGRPVLDVGIGLIGMITAYAETMLGIRYRYRDKDGHYICGPFIYMERGLGLRGMGVLYSFLCLMSSLGMGSMVQANSAISTMEYTWHVPTLAGGLIFTGLLVLVTWGGIRRIGNVAEKLVPARPESTSHFP